jgi:fructokinase
VDTTGAGDTFCGCCLDAVLLYGLDGLDENALRGMLAFANAAASLVTTKKGAIRSMPSPAQVRELIESEQRKEQEHDSL